MAEEVGHKILVVSEVPLDEVLNAMLQVRHLVADMVVGLVYGTNPMPRPARS